MMDVSSDIATFAADADDDELVFDDAEFIIAPEPEPEPAKPRRTPRRGRAAIDGEAALPGAAETPPGSASIPASPAPIPATGEEPAGPPAPVPQPDVGPAGFDRRTLMLVAIVLLALFSSLLSLGGLLAVGRTLAHAQAERARADEEGAALARVPAIVTALDRAGARLASAAARTPGGPPATVADVKQALDELKLSLAAHQPDRLNALSSMTHDGLAEIGTRLDHMATQMGGGRGANASRPANRADDRAPPS